MMVGRNLSGYQFVFVQIKGVPWTNPAGHNLPGGKCEHKYFDVPA